MKSLVYILLFLVLIPVIADLFRLVFSQTSSEYCDPSNCYDLLDVSSGASIQEITKSYHEITAAYDILKDKDSRAKYDKYLKTKKTNSRNGWLLYTFVTVSLFGVILYLSRERLITGFRSKFKKAAEFISLFLLVAALQKAREEAKGKATVQNNLNNPQFLTKRIKIDDQDWEEVLG